jgi:hypothetical protein
MYNFFIWKVSQVWLWVMCDVSQKVTNGSREGMYQDWTRIPRITWDWVEWTRNPQGIWESTRDPLGRGGGSVKYWKDARKERAKFGGGSKDLCDPSDVYWWEACYSRNMLWQHFYFSLLHAQSHVVHVWLLILICLSLLCKDFTFIIIGHTALLLCYIHIHLFVSLWHLLLCFDISLIPHLLTWFMLTYHWSWRWSTA